eukprot:jgi/Undpi1/7033/HiC_scaffold_21.g09507.m1
MVVTTAVLASGEEEKEDDAAEKPPPLPLSAEDISRFEEDGFVMLRGAFDTEGSPLGSLGRRRHIPAVPFHMGQQEGDFGNLRDTKLPKGPTRLSLDISTVSEAKGRAATADFLRLDFSLENGNPPPSAVELAVVGSNRHLYHLAHDRCNREIGLLPIFLFSDVLPCGGGTALLRGSHKKVAAILWERAGTAGMTGPEVSSAARKALLPPLDEDVIETTGNAGDVMLTHPLLLHARSSNLAGVAAGGVRLMCHPAVPLKNHLDFNVRPYH